MANILKNNAYILLLSLLATPNSFAMVASCHIPNIVQDYPQILQGQTRIDLTRKQIGDIQAQVLAEALRDNNLLQELDLHGNLIEAAGAKYICEVLKTNTVLLELNLGENYIGNKGAKAVAKLLMANHTLNNVKLNDNYIDKIGIKALANALETNDNLLVLDLQGNLQGGRAYRSKIRKKIAANNLMNKFSKISPQLTIFIAGYADNNSTVCALPKEVFFYVIQNLIDRVIFEGRHRSRIKSKESPFRTQKNVNPIP